MRMNSDLTNSKTDTMSMSIDDISKDPLGAAVQAYAENEVNQSIIVESDICDPDIIDSAYLFRTFDEMPEVEQLALQRCEGKILDIGCGAGPHLKWLTDRNKQVRGIDISKGCIDYLQSMGLNATCAALDEIEGESYDTLLLLMNGIGVAGTLRKLEHVLAHLKGLLTDTGKILLDSTDIKYLYEDEDGSFWTDINSEYYGNFMFRMTFNEHASDWFEWLYVDSQSLTEKADKAGLSCEILFEEDDHFLAELKRK